MNEKDRATLSAPSSPISVVEQGRHPGRPLTGADYVVKGMGGWVMVIVGVGGGGGGG